MSSSYHNPIIFCFCDVKGTYNTWTLNISPSNKHLKQILFGSELYLNYVDNDCINVTFLEYSYKCCFVYQMMWSGKN